jgi:hypothetical protein
MIGIAIPFHLKGGDGRAMIPNFRYLSKLPYDVLLCGSEGDRSYNFAKPFLNSTTFYEEVPQGKVCTSSGGSPELRQKFNDSLKALMQIDSYKWYCLIGANDVIGEQFFTSLCVYRYDEPTVMGVDIANNWLMHDMSTRMTVAVQVQTKRVKLAAGVNAFNQAAMLDCRMMPYVKENCEVGMEALARERGWQILPIDGTVLALKDGSDLNKFDTIRKQHKVLTISDDEFDDVTYFLSQFDNL